MLVGLLLCGLMVSFILMILIVRDKSTYIEKVTLHIFRIVRFEVEITEKRNPLTKSSQRKYNK